MRKKFLVYSIILILLSVTLTSVLSIQSAMQNAERVNINELKNYASLICRAVDEELDRGLAPDYALYAVDFGMEIGRRVTLIDSDGNVLGDTYKGDDYIRMENHRYREEVKEALAGSVGTSVRESGTFNKKFVYVAVPLIRDGKVEVVSRVAIEIDQLSIINDYIIRTALVSAAVGAIAAALLSVFYSRRLIRPVCAIMGAVSKIAEGEYGERLSVKTGDELEAIACKVNETAARLGDTIRELSDNNSKMLSVLSSMKEALIAVDNDYNLILTNNAARGMFGLTEEDLGVHLLRALRNSQVYEAFKRVVQDKYIGEQEIDYENDRILKIKTILITDRATGKELGIMALIEDVTDYRKMENIRREFVANVSHELKTPLTSIAGFVETLQNGAANDPILLERFLDIIAIESARLKRLIEDILIISDIEQGRETRSDAPFDVKAAIDETIRSLEPVTAEKRIAVIREYEEGDITVAGSVDRFRQMMVNLIENAVKYSEPDREVRITAGVKYGRVRITVRDQGFGIPEEHLSRIFERFYRVDRSRSQQEGGTGLGLAIVKHIVKLFDGEIQVRSKAGEGSEFTIIL